MRSLLVILGNMLLGAGLGGIVFVAGVLALGPSEPLVRFLRPDRLGRSTVRAAPQAAPSRPPAAAGPAGGAAAVVEPSRVQAEAVAAPAAADPASAQPALAPADPAPAEPPTRAITQLRVPQIGLKAEVVPAQLVEVAGGTTWAVPAFKAGHGEHTAGAGEPGNAVLLGHVTSLDAGNVFRELHRLRRGNLVQVVSGERTFDYRVVAVWQVPRTDLSALQPTETASVSLVTCTGAWLPALQDYAARLVVRAELVAPPAASPAAAP